MHGNDDEPTPNGAHTEVEGGDVGRRFRKLEAEDITLRAYVDTKVDEVKVEIKAIGTKMDAVIAAHNASPVKRTFDILEKMASPTSAAALLLNMLVVLLWLTGLDFDGAGYKIGAAAVKAQANEDHIGDAGSDAATAVGAVGEPQPEP